MLNTVKNIFKIDVYSNMNMYIYYLKHIKIFKNIKSTKLSKITFQLLALLIRLVTNILSKIIYILSILLISKYISKENSINTFIHIFIFFTFIGALINSKITTTSRKKYYSIMLLNMDAKQYLINSSASYLISSFMVNLIVLLAFTIKYNIDLTIPIYLSTILILSKIIGEGLTLFYYNITGKTFINSPKIYFSILITLIISAILLPLINITIPINTMPIIIMILSLLAIISIIYIINYKEYKLLYKRVLTKDKLKDDQNFSREELISINKKDYSINPTKLENKTPAEYLNTIFFERHKSILLKSAIKYSITITIIILVLLIAALINKNIKQELTTTILSYFPLIVFLMYFINKGPIVSQAMFKNCDKSLLKFSFYKEPNNINKIFKERILTISKVNLIPALPIALGLIILLVIDKKLSILYILLLALSPLSLSIFFSIYYLVTYYLLQPYNKDSKIINPIYHIINILMYFITFSISKLKTTIIAFSLTIIILTLLFTTTSLILIRKYAPQTFRIKNI